MIAHSNGVSLTSIAHPLPIIKLNPKEGRTLRYLFIASLIMIEATVWFLGIQLEWEPSFSTIGKYPCTKVQFTQEPNISSRLGDYLQGDSTFASLNTYGLALDDGLVGGMTGRPIAELYNSFRMTQDSVAFAVNTVCGQLEVIGPDGNNQTRFAMKSSQLWSTMFSAEISVHFPAGSHDWEQFAGSDVLELCTIRYTMGHANITSSFVTDKWGGLAMDSIQSITFGKLQVDRASSSGVFYGQIQNEFGSNNGYANLTSWTADAIRSVFNASYPPSQGELFCDLFEFATLPDGLYHISETWKGVTAIVAMIAHYILSHNEDSTSDVLECSYEGLQGAGVILCPDYVKVATTVSVTLCFVIEIAQLLWWFLLSGGNGKNDRVACLLDSPMMFLYYVKDTGGKLFKDCLPDMKHKGIQEFADGVHVRFGELRFTRANDTGTLVLAPPEDIIGMVAERNYFGLK
ncbi:hypothetical protein HDU83_009199 [Entophlyctis luteolus]|nr:hypothetical protein HDU83_009199 [Entophlyctis luteolus]